MVEQDYILREVAKIAQVLAAVLHLKREGLGEQAQQTLDDALGEITGVPLSHLRHFDDEGLLALCTSKDGHFSPERAVAIADLLRQDEDPRGQSRANHLYAAAQAAGGTIPWDAMSVA
jgi:hypothetical protein